MNHLQRKKLDAANVFSLSLELVDSDPTFFRLIGYLDGNIIAKAHGDFRDQATFRLVNIDVYDQCRRGKGYATIMINVLMDLAYSKGCNKFVFIGVANTNQTARDLYSRFGACESAIQNCQTRMDFVCSPLWASPCNEGG